MTTDIPKIVNNNPAIIELESSKEFRKSKLWSFQKDFYKNQGISAWVGKVPFYVTSNCFLANKYAELIINLISDGLRTKTINIKHPIYIFELGAGSGKFAYHVLNELVKFRTNHKELNIDFRYIITDLSQKNIDFWKKHHQLKNFVTDGILDMAVFDADFCNNITTMFAKKEFTPNLLKNPPIVLGNYFLDSITCDLLRFSNGNIEQVNLSLSTKVKNFNKNTIDDLKSIDIKYHFTPFAIKEIKDKKLANLIKYYKNNIKNNSVLIPLTAFRVINYFSRFQKKNKAFFIFSDKGHTSLDAMQVLKDPHIAFHGSFSLMVNFHAIKSYYSQKTSNDILLQNDIEGISMLALAINESFDKFSFFRNGYFNYANGFNIQSFIVMKKHFMSKLSELSFADILAFLKLSQWDSKILTEVANELVQKISSLSVKMRNDLAVNLRKLEKNHYFLPNRENSIFELARINYCLGNYAEAVRLYKISIKHYGESLETLFNMGLSAYYANQKQLSCDIIKKLVKLDPKDTEAIEWLDRIEKELNL